jgi:hypothetical protein
MFYDGTTGLGMRGIDEAAWNGLTMDMHMVEIP